MVKGVSANSFGLVIAYLVPGLVGMSILSEFIPPIELWFGRSSESPTIGGFLYGTLGALGTGLTLSAIRWLTLDRFHHATGLPAPTLDFSRLRDHFDAYQGIVDNHFRYYQFYGNMLLAITLLPLAPNLAPAWLGSLAGWLLGGVLLVVYFLASRDSLAKYYARSAAMLSLPPSSQEHCDDERLPSSQTATEPEPR